MSRFFALKYFDEVIVGNVVGGNMGKQTYILFITSVIALSGCESNSVNGYFVGMPASASSSSTSTSSIGGNGGGASTITLKTIQPAFAVRGLNCMTCHGVIGSNVVTDFGYQTGNLQDMFAGLRTAFNDNQSGWQQVQISGDLHVPKVNFSSSDASTYFENSSINSFASFLSTPNLGGNAAAIAASVAGTVVEDSMISIKYPTEQELIALLPANLQNKIAAVSVINLPGVTNASQSGLGISSSGKYIENTQSAVTCYGDIAVKGPLFLNNVNLITDGNGCRLYVAGTVFIQGPINHVNGSTSNLQITSSRAVVMGFSTHQMGSTGGTNPVRVYGEDDSIVTAGGPYPRFQSSLDVQYDPSGANINGVSQGTFFDNIVLDANAIGANLVDAGEPAAFNNLVAGESVIAETQPGDEQGSYGGKRVAINYSGLLLNAPHIHSRYGGNFSGVIIGDVAMLARNPDNTESLEQYSYDQRFNNVPAILPALTTTIFDLKH